MRTRDRAWLKLRGRAALAPFLTALLNSRSLFVVRSLSVAASLSALVVLLSVSFAVQAQTPQATPPPPAPPRSATFPKPVEQTLPNGLRVIVIERHESPLVS